MSNSSTSFRKISSLDFNTSVSCSYLSCLKFKNVHLVSNLDLPGSSFQTLVLASYLLLDFLFNPYYLFFVKAFIIQTIIVFFFMNVTAYLPWYSEWSSACWGLTLNLSLESSIL